MGNKGRAGTKCGARERVKTKACPDCDTCKKTRGECTIKNKLCVNVNTRNADQPNPKPNWWIKWDSPTTDDTECKDLKDKQAHPDHKQEAESPAGSNWKAKNADKKEAKKAAKDTAKKTAKEAAKKEAKKAAKKEAKKAVKKEEKNAAKEETKKAKKKQAKPVAKEAKNTAKKTAKKAAKKTAKKEA